MRAPDARPHPRRTSILAVAAATVAAVVASLALAPAMAQAEPQTRSVSASMPVIESSQYAAQAAALPAALADALVRDLDLSPEEYLARSDAAVEAVEVVESLGDGGVDVLASRLDGTQLVVNVESPEDAAVVESAGAVAEIGEPVKKADYSGLVLNPLADLVGGQGYTFATLNGSVRVNHTCSIAFNGTSKSTGQSQFLTAGHCLAPGRQDGGGFFEARQSAAGSSVARGSAIGTPIESSFRFGAGVDAGLVATAPGWTPRSLVSTWGGSTGAVTQGNPVAITQMSPGIVGAPICKSGRTTGWTCGEILELNYPTQVYNGTSGVPVIVNLTLTSACMLEGDSGSAAVIGNAAFGIGTAGSWVTNCSRSSQPDAISAFFPLVTTDGSASVTSALPDWKLQTGSPYGNDWSPLGNLENASASLKTSTFSGWTFDPDSADPTTIHVYVGGTYITGTWGGVFDARASRPDVAAALPGAGGNRGFAISLPSRPGSVQYCLYAINVGAGHNTDLGCRTVTAPTGPPVGNLESAQLTGTTVSLSGWAIDPDTAASITMHVYVNGGWGGAFSAAVPRPDVGRAFPEYGSAHGFSIPALKVPVGTSTVCVYGIDQAGAIINSQIGCRTVSTGSGPPKGTIDSVTPALGSVTVAGWALDPDTADPVDVHVYIDGGWGAITKASTSRPDVGRVFPGYGDKHGFSVTFGAAGGVHTVCVYAINIGAGASNPQLGCMAVTVPGGDPFGNVESVTLSGGKATVQGWVIDPDQAGPVDVHIYVDDAWGGLLVANRDRPDVGRVFPLYGAKHGFSGTVLVPPGAKRVCAFAINVGSGTTNPQFGCVAVR